MMPSEAAFLAAIIADPEDDAPRLIYADYLIFAVVRVE
jgi:uncharacterized protein (TIGR02996 family)